MTATGKNAKSIVAEKGLGQISDAGELEAIVARIVAANPGPAEEFRQGRDRVLGFFVGQVMKETRGQANPQMVNELLRSIWRPMAMVRSGRCISRRRLKTGPISGTLPYLFRTRYRAGLQQSVGQRSNMPGRCQRRAIHRCAPGIVPRSEDRGYHLGQVDASHPARSLQRHQPLQRAGALAHRHQPQDAVRTAQGTGEGRHRHAQELRRSPSPGRVHSHRAWAGISSRSSTTCATTAPSGSNDGRPPASISSDDDAPGA